MKKLIIPVIIFLTIVSMVSAVDIASDSFESNSWSGGLGWSGDWVVNEGYAIVYYGSHDSGTYSAYMSGKASIQRDVDTTGYSDVTLGFWVWPVNVPVSVNYTIDGVETNLVTITSTGSWTYYEYTLPAGVTTLKFSDDGYSSQSYIDDITITGEVGVKPEISLIMDNNYVVDTLAVISIDSTEINTIHTLELYDSSNNLFCNKNIVSPSVSHTLFTTTCDMPSSSSVDAKALIYVLNDNTINDTKYFNIISLTQNPNEVDIKQTYFSSQVLQGGSTEIFTIIESTNPIEYAQIELTYPNNDKRLLYMEPTSNLNEYKVLITDTFLVGNVSFKIQTKSGDYFDIYNNQYEVVQYNLDFVQLVNQVSEVLNVKTVEEVLDDNMNLHGTEYRAGENGKIFLQLLDDGDRTFVNDSTCFAKAFEPDLDVWFNYTLMDYADDGLYHLDFMAPDGPGIYMLSAYCVTPHIDIVEADDDFECGGNNCGTGWENSWSIIGSCSVSTSDSPRGSYHLRSTNDCNAEREVNTTSCTEGYLSFWAKSRLLESGDDCNYYYNDGTTDNLLLTLTDGQDDDVYRYYSYEVCDTYGTASNAGIRFQSDTGSSDYCYIDDIEFSLINEYNETQYQFIRGSGEIHINDWFNNYTGLISDAVWNYNSRTLTDYNQSNLTLDVWNYPNRNLTYYPPVEVNVTAVAEAVWDWGGFINPVILNNVTSTVWEYVARYTHGIIT